MGNERMIVYLVVAKRNNLSWVVEVFENQADAEAYRKYEEITFSRLGFDYDIDIMPLHKKGERFWE